jgi:hypothetical protein
MRSLLFISLLMMSMLTFAGCSRAAPQILLYSMSLVYYQNGANYDSRLSFFVLPDDPDGIDDVTELRLEHDFEGLRWILTKDDWVSYVDGEKTWVGSYSLAMRDGEALPSGQYKATLIDTGGEKSERVIGFDVPSEHHFPFPKLTVTGGEYRIVCEYPDLAFLCYDAQGAYLRNMPITAKDGTVDSLSLASNVSSIALWARDPDRNTSALTDVVWIR